MQETAKTPVTERALVARINRKLAHTDETLRRTRQGTRAEQDLGEYYIVNRYFNGVTDDHCDPETLGRELGVLHEEEVVA